MNLVIAIASLLLLGHVSGEISTTSSPAQAPAADLLPDSPPLHAPAPESGSPSPAEYSSPPKPEPEHSPSPSPSPSISQPLPDAHASPSSSPSPSLSPSLEPSDLNHSDLTAIEERKSSGGMSGGTKAGIAFGAVAAVCVVGVAGFVYKKRQENIRRSRYGYAARDIL